MNDRGAALSALAAATRGTSRRNRLKYFFRRIAHGSGRWILRIRSSEISFSPGAVTLVLAPHPDDEVFGCGGLILRKRLAGQAVHVLYLTDGSASHPSHPTLSPAQLKVLRAKEALAALQVLRVEPANAYFLDIPDGSLDQLDHDTQTALIKNIQDVLRVVKPDEIFLPHRRDGSSEHEAAFRIFHAVWSSLSPRPRRLEFPIWSGWSPRLLFRLAFTRARVTRCSFSEYEAVKRQAIGAYRSQTEPVAPWTEPVLPAGFAEAFSTDEEFFFEID